MANAGYTFTFIAITMNTLPPLIFKKELTFEIWYPCDQTNNNLCYWISLIHKIIGSFHIGFSNLSYNFLIFAFVNYISLQTHLIGLRFSKIVCKFVKKKNNEKLTFDIAVCIKHHQNILL